MELLESQIEAFVSTDVGYGGGGDDDDNSNGSGNGNGYGCGYGYGNDYGYGDGNGYGSGCGNGDGSGDGYGCGDGDGYGCGFGDGSGYGNGDGSGYGKGYGFGDGYGYGCGFGDGDGDGSGIAEIDGYKVYDIDNINSVITSIHGNVAQGYIIEKNTHLVPCFIVKEDNSFAHGKTLHEAYAALQEKLYDNSTEEERIAAFVKKFPDYNTPYDNADLFAYHHVLTGSCRMGRESFVKSHGLSLDGTTTVKEFINLTKDSYGGEIIKRLKEEYK